MSIRTQIVLHYTNRYISTSQHHSLNLTSSPIFMIYACEYILQTSYLINLTYFVVVIKYNS